MPNDNKEWKHDDLADDLAALLQTSYVRVPLGSVWMGQHAVNQKRMENLHNGIGYYTPVKGVATQHADVVAIKPSYTRFCLSIYEVKISRSDFLSDLRSEKWRGYLPYCHRFYFAFGPGVKCTKDELPGEAGLIVRGEKGWKYQKQALVRDVTPDEEFYLSMLFLRRRKSLRERNLQRATWNFRHSYHQNEQARMVGKEIAEAWAKRHEWESLSAQLRDMKECIRRSLNDALGADKEYAEYDLYATVREIAEMRDLLRKAVISQ